MVRQPRFGLFVMTRAGEQHDAWRRLPVGDIDDVIGPGWCLVLAPHPDDESLGCGGLIAECCQQGRAPIVACLTDGGMSHPGSRTYYRERLVQLREAEMRAATSRLGLPADRLVFLRQPDSQIPHEGPFFDRIVSQIVDLASHSACSCILTSWRFDPHCDHEAAALIAGAAAESCRVRHVAFPVWGWTLPPHQTVNTPLPDGWRLDVASHLDRKRHALAAHASQYGDLIKDDPSGFRLPPELLDVFAGPFETFLQQ